MLAHQRVHLVECLIALFTLATAHTPRAIAWSYKEHIQFSRLAAQRLLDDDSVPAAMKDWLRRAVPNRMDLAAEEDFFYQVHVGLAPRGYEGTILHWSYVPDVHALNDRQSSKVLPYNAHERLMHFIDLEYFQPGQTRRAYRHDLSGKPAIELIPNDLHDPRFIQAGYLPLRVVEMYANLVKYIREDRLDPIAGDTNAAHAMYFAGYLSHYLADNTQPQHATIDYKSQSYFKNSRRAPNVHAAVEYLMCDDEKDDQLELRREFWPMFAQQLGKFADPVETNDLFRATLEIASRSYDGLPLIGEAAAASVVSRPGERSDALDLKKFFRFRGRVNGVEMSVMELKARQTAWAVKRIERVWKQAWVEARGS